MALLRPCHDMPACTDLIAAMAEDLEASENADEKKAADGFKAMLAAFPEHEKSPVNPKINEASTAWRNRRDSNPR